MRAAIYSRKSKFTGKGESIENQVRMCRDYARDALHISPDDIVTYEDEGFSGGTTDRPRFQHMLEDAQARRFDVLICYRLDRISRNVADFSTLMERFERLGIGFVSVRERFDTTNPMGRAMLYISSVFAQLERETIAERVRDNMLQLSRTGRWLGGRVPMGYASERVQQGDADGKPRSRYRLVVIEHEARTVRHLFDMYLRLGNVSRLVAYCQQRRILNSNGAPYTAHPLLFLLHNPVYCRATPDAYDYLIGRVGEICAAREAFDGTRGLMPYNRTNQNAHARGRKAMAEWVIALGEHEGIVDADLWIGVQERMKANTAKGFRAPRRIDAMLSGVLRCGACGAYMRPRGENKCNPPKHYYSCETKVRSHGALCTMRNVDGVRLDRAVRAYVEANLPPPPDVRAALAGHMDEIQCDEGGGAERTDKLERERQALAREIDRLADALALVEGDAAAAIVRQIESREAKRRDLDARIERAATRPDGDAQEALLAQIEAIASESARATNGEMRDALRAAGVSVRWDGVRAVIERATEEAAQSR